MSLKKAVLKPIPITFYIFLAALIAILFLPELLMHGMFFDGVTYASVARNLSEGLGTFWEPHYTEVIYPEFHEHPPLAIGIQSLAFRIFGDHFYIEKVYSFLLFILASIGIFKIWSLFSDENDGWIPILLMLTIPIILWSFRNNMLENSVIVLTVFATYYYVNFSKNKSIYHLFLGSFFVVAAFLSKGPVGLFPIVTPLFYLKIFHQVTIKHILFSFAKVILSLTSFFLIIYIAFPEFEVSIIKYFDQQLFPALNNEREITTSFRFKILLDLLLQLAIPLTILFLTLISSKNRPLKFSKEFWFFILIGLSASLPLIISLKQRSFYLLPSMPYYIIALALLYKPVIHRAIGLINVNVNRIIRVLSLLLIIISFILCYINYDHYLRDETIIKDVIAISQDVPSYTVVSTTNNICFNWTLVAYMMRYAKISIDCESDTKYELFEINERYELRDRIRE